MHKDESVVIYTHNQIQIFWNLYPVYVIFVTVEGMNLI